VRRSASAIHWTRKEGSSRIACGRTSRAFYGNLNILRTTDPAKVTCLHCRKATGYEQAVPK
jgi:hypothetical protein